jgi:hypothetical protein
MLNLCQQSLNMKKHLISLIACLSIVAFSAPSCDKDEDPPPTKTEVISRSPWIFLSATANGSDVSNTPQLACFKDNTITFAENNTYTVVEGAVVCNPSTAGTFNWSFQNSETTLVLDQPLFPGGSGSFTIVSLTESNLVISQLVTLPAPFGATTVVITLKH